MSSVRPAEEDRLPWLEPYRDPIAQKQRVGRRSRGGLAAVVTASVLLPAGIGAGFWLGQRSDAPVASRQPSTTIALPPARPFETAEASLNAAVVPGEPVGADNPPADAAEAERPPPTPAKAEAARPVKKAAQPPQRKVLSAARKSNLSTARAAQNARRKAGPGRKCRRRGRRGRSSSSAHSARRAAPAKPTAPASPAIHRSPKCRRSSCPW